MNHYYDFKYPHLQYYCADYDNNHICCSIPPQMLAEKYMQKFGTTPKTFFDCGAGAGMIIQMATKYGMDARGIDIHKYPSQPAIIKMKLNGTMVTYPTPNVNEFIKSGRIQIKSITACKPINADIVFCNGSLACLHEKEIPNTLLKFKNAKMVCMIDNTTEDIEWAKSMGDDLLADNATRTIRPNTWWIKQFENTGFVTEFDNHLHSIIAVNKR